MFLIVSFNKNITGTNVLLSHCLPIVFASPGAFIIPRDALFLWLTRSCFGVGNVVNPRQRVPLIQSKLVSVLHLRNYRHINLFSDRPQYNQLSYLFQIMFSISLHRTLQVPAVNTRMTRFNIQQDRQCTIT